MSTLSANQLSENTEFHETVYQDIDKLNTFLEEGQLSSRIVKVPRKRNKLSADEERKKVHLAIVINKHQSGVQDYSPEYRESELIKRLFINQEELDIYDFAERNKSSHRNQQFIEILIN